MAGWNIVYSDGDVAGYFCPDCQTADENAEAQVNAATLDYIGADQFGKQLARIKGSAA